MNKQEITKAILDLGTIRIQDESVTRSYIEKQPVLDIVAEIEKPLITQYRATKILTEQGYSVLRKPIIPEFVADDIFACQVNSGTVIDSIQNAPDEIKEWINENGSELYIRAWVIGWDIEKEKKYMVRLPQINGSDEKFLVQAKCIDEYWIDGDLDFIERADLKVKFTEKEIKAIDERYWAFAEEVTE